jgi:hypothetical protein
MMRRLVLAVTIAALCAGAGTALAVGPWPGLADGVSAGPLLYKTTRAGGVTTLSVLRDGNVVRSVRIDGAYGVPAVTSVGEPGGLSPDGKLLVLVPPPQYDGLRAESRFVVVSTATLATVATPTLRGEFGFDAFSPNGRYLYVIQHISRRDLVRYVVRAFDLRTNRLLPGAIVDKRSPNEAMRGYPVSRATSPGGTWVYTLYTRNPGSSLNFVHALNAAGRYAFCIDLPSWPSGRQIWDATLALSGRILYVRGKDGSTIARIDTRTLKAVTVSGT